MLVAVRCCRTWILHCITFVKRSPFSNIGRCRFQLFLVNTGTVPTRTAGCQRLVPVQSQEKVKSQLADNLARIWISGCSCLFSGVFEVASHWRYSQNEGAWQVQFFEVRSRRQTCPETAKREQIVQKKAEFRTEQRNFCETSRSGGQTCSKQARTDVPYKKWANPVPNLTAY